MQRGLSLQDLAAKITANQELKRDFIADTPALTMQVQDDGKTALELADVGSFPVLAHAHDQIGDEP